MRVLIDSNVILDVILKRSPFDIASYEILKRAEKKAIEAYIGFFRSNRPLLFHLKKFRKR